MIKRIVKMVIISGLLLNFLFFVKLVAQEYKDVNPKVKSAIKKFTTQGVLSEFISRYGKEYFRPTATVKREDLIVAIYEYDKVTRTLMEYQKVLEKKIRDLTTELKTLKRQTAALQKKRKVSNVDKVMAEVQKNLPVLMSSGPIPQKIDERFIRLENEVDLMKAGGRGGKSSVAVITRVIRTSPRIKKEIKKEVQEILDKGPRARAVKGTVDMNKIIKEVRKELPRLIGTVPIPKKIQVQFIAIKEKLSLLEGLSEEIGEDMFANMLKNSRKVKKVLKKEIREINSKRFRRSIK